MSRLFMVSASLMGVLIGAIPVIGQIVGVLAYSESRNGNEMAPYSLGFAIGSAVGTVAFVILFFVLR